MGQDRIQQLVTELIDAATRLMIEVLRVSSALHKEGKFGELDRMFHELEGVLPGGKHQVIIAWEFYMGWVDASNHNFLVNYEGIAKDDWPRLAQHLADRLVANGEITDPLILSHFDYRRPRTPLLQNLKRLFRRGSE